MPARTDDLFEPLAPAPASPVLALVPAEPPGALRPVARELWLCAYLPHLPLEALDAGGGPAGHEVACAVEGGGARQAVVAASEAARRRGVVPGTGLNAALALVPGLVVRERRPAAEAALLDRLARWATQFTPVVSLEPPDALLAEVRGSLGLFGGAEALRRCAGRELHGFGLHAVTAIAPTPRAALWLVRAGLGLCVKSADGLPSLASRLPLGCLGWPEASTRTLASLGVRTLADLARLPRDGFARRFGPALLDELDEGFGRRHAPRRRAVMPERFDECLELPMESGSLGLIEIALAALLGRLQDFLRARAAGVSGLAVEFRHRAAPATRFRLGLARPSGDGDHLFTLLRERLGRTSLPAPTRSLRMRSTVALPLPLQDRPLLDRVQQDTDPEDAARLVERLRARLGSDAVFSVCLVPEHRPESAWRVAEPEIVYGERGGRGPRSERISCGEGRGMPPAVRGGERGSRGPRGERISVERAQRDPAGSRSPPQTPPQARCRSPRPLWMLTEPQQLREHDGAPLHDNQSLELAGGPERIETGWWDGRDVRRDYYAARTRSGVRLWVYRERGRDGGWWLHGVFG